MTLQLQTAKVEPDITVVRLVGSLTAEPEGHALQLLVRDLVDRGVKKLILDLSRVEKIDSAAAQFVVQSFFSMR
jgi:anti-anti-sigma regulatory factor